MGSNSDAGDGRSSAGAVGAGDRLWLATSLAMLAATLVWFFGYADPGASTRQAGAEPGHLRGLDPNAGFSATDLGSGSAAARELATGVGGQSPAEGDASVAESAVAPHFMVGERCGLCHAESTRAQAMRDAGGESVAPFDLWSTSMMAQSARDPYWRAVLSAEVALHPGQKAHLEEVCTRCHAPMAGEVETSPAGQVLAFLQPTSPHADLALDGVSCVVCHQMTDANFGTAASFTGGFELNRDAVLYGPHADPVTMPMQRHVGYTPAFGPHVNQSAMCATCHTVITTAVTPDGTMTDQPFHEQAPYLEWRNSVFNNEVPTPAAEARSCQGCHMPTTDEQGQPIATALAHNPGGRDFPFLEPRQPYGRHTLVGGNAFMTRLLRDNAEELGIAAPQAAFDASLTAIQRMLQRETARVSIGAAVRESDQWQIPVTVSNLCGHKFPTAYPSRRAWLQVEVWAADGTLLLASGRVNDQGQLLGAGGQVLPSEFSGGQVLPHFDRIFESQQVQVYETVMGDTDGQPTFSLLEGAAFLKDNRLLPLGWRAEHADGPATQPAGVVADDNFTAGQDRVLYQVPAAGPPPHRIEVSLYFQSISPRHAAELFVHDTPEVAAFQRMYSRADHQPERIDHQVKTLVGRSP